MAWTIPATWSSGAILTAAQLNTQLRDNLLAITGAWNSFTTTWSGTIGNGTKTSFYSRVGRVITFRIKIVWGTTTTHPASTQTFTLPVTAHAEYGLGACCGQGTMYDSSAAAYGGNGIAAITAADTIGINTGGGITFWSNTAPVTWANGDVLVITGDYEASTD